jgi:hypothetical protein
MKTFICTLPPGGSITVGIGDTGRTFRGGDAVDLEAIAVPASKDRPAETWRQVLGEHASAFTESADPQTFWQGDASPAADTEQGEE